MLAERTNGATAPAPANPEDVARRELAERRLSALAYAFRQHEWVGRATRGARGPQLAVFSRRLREILGSF